MGKEKEKNAEDSEEPSETPSPEKEGETEETGVVDYDEIVSGSISEAKEKLSDMDDPDLDAAISAEKENKNRKTLIDWIENQQEDDKEFLKTGVPGFDPLFKRGIPQGASVLMAGGAGSGKTIFCLQTLITQAKKGKNCLFMSFEETEEALVDHMEEFGWDAKELIDEGNLKIKKYSPFKTGRQVEAMLAKEKGELKVDVDPVVIPEDFDPDLIVLDSLTAVASAFQGGEDSYRIFIEQLFRFFQDIGATSLMITETKQEPEKFSPTGVEEFLADGVIVLYSLKHGTTLKRALQVIKMRGENFSRDMNVFNISGEGITIKPDEDLY